MPALSRWQSINSGGDSPDALVTRCVPAYPLDVSRVVCGRGCHHRFTLGPPSSWCRTPCRRRGRPPPSAPAGRERAPPAGGRAVPLPVGECADLRALPGVMGPSGARCPPRLRRRTRASVVPTRDRWTPRCRSRVRRTAAQQRRRVPPVAQQRGDDLGVERRAQLAPGHELVHHAAGTYAEPPGRPDPDEPQS